MVMVMFSDDQTNTFLSPQHNSKGGFNVYIAAWSAGAQFGSGAAAVFVVGAWQSSW